MTADLLGSLAAIVGDAFVHTDEATRGACSVDGLKRNGRLPDAVVRPGTTAEVSRVLAACNAARVPVVPRGAGTGYSGGAVPVNGGLVLAMDRFDRLIEIDPPNLLAVVEPNVVTGAFQAAVERQGLFYPPDPASLAECAIGGNVAECAGGPRAFKYGTTRNYVLGLEAVLPGGEVIATGGKTVKNVVGYDLTRLLVGSEGTLAVITKVILRLLPLPPARVTLTASFGTVGGAAEAVTAMVAAGVTPATVELVDRVSLEAVARFLGEPALAPSGVGALLLIETDGVLAAAEEEATRAERACRSSGAVAIQRAAGADERERLWRVRRQLSPALKTISSFKLNHDVVVPKGRIPALFETIDDLRRRTGLTIPCFGHAGDGNIHVNIMADPANSGEVARARQAEAALLERVVALEGSISGEHGIGFTKRAFIGLELGPDTLAVMRRIKAAFDPNGILNPGKIFP